MGTFGERKYQLPQPPLIDIADSAADLHYLLEQLEVLANDLCQNYFHQTTTPSTRFVRQQRLKAARIKADLLYDQTFAALQKAYLLRTLTQTIAVTEDK